jgi:MFS family permease
MEELESHLLVPRCGCALSTLSSRNLLARACSLWFFLLEGIITGVWSVSLSYLEDNLGFSNSELGFAVLFAYVGTVVSTFLVAALLRRFGAQRTALFSSVAYSASLPLIGLCGSFSTLAAAMFLFGVLWGMEDVCANSSAVQTEIVAGKALIGSCHGSYSLAAAASSFVGAAILAHSPVVQTFVLVSLLCGGLSLSASWGLYDLKQEQQIVLYNNHMTHMSHMSHREKAGVCIYGTTPHAARQSRESTETREFWESRESTRRETWESRESREPLLSYAPASDVEQAGSRLSQPLMPPAQVNPSTGDKSTDAMCDVGNMGVPSAGAGADADVGADTGTGTYTGTYTDTGAYTGTYTDTDAYTGIGRSPLFYLCCLGFAAEFGEASIVTWSIIYYDKVLHADSLTRSVGFTCFMVAMAAGRFSCDYLRRRLGRRVIVQLSGVLALGGLVLVLSVAELQTNALALTSIGLTLTGLGLSTLLPIVFSSAGHLTTGHSGTGVATAAGCAYCASIISSPLVGVTSDLCGGLRVGMTLVAAVCGLITPIGFFIPHETSRLHSKE